MGISNTVILLGGILVFSSVLASTVSARLGVPLLLVFLIVGMLAGEDGPGAIHFSDFSNAFLIGNLSLAIILLDGGLRTKMSTFRVALWPAVSLATVGVAVTSGLVGAFTSLLFHLPWVNGFLLGAIIGSTDAAAVFSLLRQSGVKLNERVSSTLEIESGANDPMAIFLVLMIVEFLIQPVHPSWQALTLTFIQEIGLGGVCGVAGGWLLARLVVGLKLPEGMYALLILSGGLVIFSAVNSIHGSGFLAVYLTGLMIGNNRSHATEHVMKVMDGLAWLSQAGMFLILGLLVTPSKLLEHAWQGLAVVGFLLFVARPIAVTASLTPFRFPWREIGYISWLGLRGAVPIVLAVFPVMAGVPDARSLFDVTFVVVLVSLLIQGATVAPAAKLFKVIIPPRAEPIDRQEIWAGAALPVEVVQFLVERDAPANQRSLESLLNKVDDPRFTPVFVAREGKLLSASPELELQEKDVVGWLATTDELDPLSHVFTRQRQRGRLANRVFFGEFVLDAGAAAGDLSFAYGIDVDPDEANLTLGQLVERRLGRPAVVGDRVQLNNVTLTVRVESQGRIMQVGLKLNPKSGDD
ncbi:MAG TPA: potassium/proton antiporter [Pseudomonadales bacterium]|nr:potassium/proton antiporter [Pseudomonadales bacterium]